VNLDEAYARCEEITATEARNFSYGIRLLRDPERRAMSALYAVARRIDDIGDGHEPPGDRLKALGQVRDQIEGLAADVDGNDPVLMALADVAQRYPLPISALVELIEGCEMDVEGTHYDSFDDLVGYCRRVAGTVGRLSLAIYGCADPETGQMLADQLGVALQITNIVRDIVEDRDTMGRVYLPTEDLARFGVDEHVRGTPDALAALICFETGRAEEWYATGLELLPMLDRRSRACTAAMAGIYRRLLDQIRRDPLSVLHRRVSLAGWQKGAVAANALIRGSA
jgi:phytoene synthase